MAIPTRDHVLAWNAAPLETLAADAEAIVRGIDAAADTMDATIDALPWSGDAKRMADTRAESEKRQMRAVAGAYDRLSVACQNAHNRMNPIIEDIKSIVRHIEVAPVVVGSDWTVHNMEDTEEAVNISVQLRELASALGIADEDCSAAIAGATEDIAALAPVTAGFSGVGAERDLQDLADGDASREVLSRLQLGTTLREEELAALAAGQQIDLSQGQFDYLSALMRAQDGMSLDEIGDIGRGLPAEQWGSVQSNLANAMQIISNPQVHTVGFDGAPAVDRGGMSHLPAAVESLLVDSPVQDLDYPVTGSTEMSRAGDFFALKNILATGDPAFAEGSDLDRGLIKQAAEIMRASGDSTTWSWTLDEHGSKVVDERSVIGLANDILGVAASDNTAVHDALTGDNMSATIGNGGRYSASEHIDGLLNRDWGGQDQAMVRLLDTVGENATSADQSLNTQSGESAHALAVYVGDHQAALLDVNGEPVGRVNPDTAGALGRTLSNYIPNMVGVGDDLLQSHGFASLNSDQAKSVFAIVDSGPGAGEFNTAAYASISQLATQFGMGGAEDSSLGQFASRIDWAAQQGMNDELTARIEDQTQRRQEMSDFYDSLKAGIYAGAGSIPAVGPFGAAIVDIGYPQLKPMLMSSVPDLGPAADIGSQGSAAGQYYDILRGAFAADPSIGANPDLAKYFNQDGTLKSFTDVAGGNGRENLPGFNDAMLHALPGLTFYQSQWETGQDPRFSAWNPQ